MTKMMEFDQMRALTERVSELERRVQWLMLVLGVTTMMLAVLGAMTVG